MRFDNRFRACKGNCVGFIGKYKDLCGLFINPTVRPKTTRHYTKVLMLFLKYRSTPKVLHYNPVQVLNSCSQFE